MNWCKLYFLLALFFIGNGIMVGWAVSLFLSCGKFDTQAYMKSYLADNYNCNYDYINTTSTTCTETAIRDARSHASDLALSECFKYCGLGGVVGFCMTWIACAGFVAVVHQERLKASLIHIKNKWTELTSSNDNEYREPFLNK